MAGQQSLPSGCLVETIGCESGYGGAFGSKMQLDRNLHIIPLDRTACYSFVSCMPFDRAFMAFDRTRLSIVPGIRSYSTFGRTPHSVVPSIRSYSPFDRTEHSVVLQWWLDTARKASWANYRFELSSNESSWCADLEQLQILTTRSTNRDNLKLARFLTSCNQLLIPSD